MRIFKFFTGAAGTLAVLIGVPMLIGGTVLFSWAAGEDRAELPRVFVTDYDGVLSADFTIDHIVDVEEWLTDVEVSATSDEALFVGIGSQADVERFLSSGRTPGGEAFWVATNEGDVVALDWSPRQGDWTVVVMNADGTGPVDAVVEASLDAAPLRIAGAVVGILGLISVAGGAVLIGVGWGRSRRPAIEPSAPAAA
jgi:hypothetical protein